MSGRAGPAGRPRIPARKRWGQHFLASPETAARIVDAARVGPEDMRARGRPRRRRADAVPRGDARARVVAVEIDPLRRRSARRGVRGRRARPGLPGRRPRAGPSRAGSTPAGCTGDGAARGEPSLQRRDADPVRRLSSRAARSAARSRRSSARSRAASSRGPGSEGYGYLSVRAAALADGTDPLRSAPGRVPAAAEGDLERSRAHAARRRPLDPTASAARLRSPRSASTRAARRSPTRSRRRRRGPVGSGARQRSGKTPRARAEELSLDDFLVAGAAELSARESRERARSRSSRSAVSASSGRTSSGCAAKASSILVDVGVSFPDETFPGVDRIAPDLAAICAASGSTASS